MIATIFLAGIETGINREVKTLMDLEKLFEDIGQTRIEKVVLFDFTERPQLALDEIQRQFSFRPRSTLES